MAMVIRRLEISQDFPFHGWVLWPLGCRMMWWWLLCAEPSSTELAGDACRAGKQRQLSLRLGAATQGFSRRALDQLCACRCLSNMSGENLCVNIRQRWSKGFRAVPCEKASSLMHMSTCPGLLVSLVLWKFSVLLYEITDSPHVKMIFRVQTLPLDWVILTVCFCSSRTRLRLACSLLYASRAVGKWLETFLWYKFCLGAYGNNNHKLLGSILHLWRYFLCSQRAEDSL